MNRGKFKLAVVILVIVGMSFVRPGFAQEGEMGEIEPPDGAVVEETADLGAEDAGTEVEISDLTDELESMRLIWIYEGNKRKLAYVVQTGDTLWAIAGKYLNDNYYWPKIWERNSFIVNPHLIFPGDIIYIYPDGVVEQPKLSDVPEVGPITDDGLLSVNYNRRGSTGFVDKETLDEAGRILANRNNEKLLGEGDIVYINVGKLDKMEVGETFSIFRVKSDPRSGDWTPVNHPVTGELVGYMTQNLGELSITKVDTKSSEAVIVNSYEEIHNNDLITGYITPLDVEVDLASTEIEELKAYIVASKNNVKLLGNGSVVYIDKGAEHGVMRGNVFQIYDPCELVEDKVSGEFLRIPEKILGQMVVLEARSKTAVGYIFRAEEEIMIGDHLLMSKYASWEIEGISSMLELDRCRTEPTCRIISQDEYLAGADRPYCTPNEEEVEEKGSRWDIFKKKPANE